MKIEGINVSKEIACAVVLLMGIKNPRIFHYVENAKDKRVQKKNFKHLCRLANRYMANTEPFKKHKIKIKGL